MPLMTLVQALDPEFRYTFGDPRPLADLAAVQPDHWRLRLKAVKAWVREHPNMAGYLTMRYLEGHPDRRHFFQVTADGGVSGSSAQDCLPKFFAWQVQR